MKDKTTIKISFNENSVNIETSFENFKEIIECLKKPNSTIYFSAGYAENKKLDKELFANRNEAVYQKYSLS